MSRISRARAALRVLLDGKPSATVHAVHALHRVV
jgi:hypothetical protein